MSPCLALASRSLSSLLAKIPSHVCIGLFPFFLVHLNASPHVCPYGDECVCAYGHTHCSAGDDIQGLHTLGKCSRYYWTVWPTLHPYLVIKAMCQFPPSVRTVSARVRLWVMVRRSLVWGFTGIGVCIIRGAGTHVRKPLSHWLRVLSRQFCLLIYKVVGLWPLVIIVCVRNWQVINCNVYLFFQLKN